jgi:hypothetical protein
VLLAFALLAAGCKCQDQDEEEPKSLFGSVAKLTQDFGRAPDRVLELGEGQKLVVWEFMQQFTELEPGRFYFIGVTGKSGKILEGGLVAESAPMPKSGATPEGLELRSTLGAQELLLLTGGESLPHERKTILERMGWLAGG